MNNKRNEEDRQRKMNFRKNKTSNDYSTLTLKIIVSLKIEKIIDLQKSIAKILQKESIENDLK